MHTTPRTMKEFLKGMSFGIEEFLLALIIVFHVLDSFEVLPADLDYVKKIISWAALGYILYRARPTRILTGTDAPRTDVLLIIAYFLLTIKNLVSYAMSTVGKVSSFLKPFYTMLIENTSTIETGGIYIGLILLLYISIRYALKLKFRTPSVMHLVHGDRLSSRRGAHSFLRILTSFLILLGFLVVIFNLCMEWLAIAIDAPLVIMALAVYFFFIFKYRMHFSPKTLLGRIGNFGESFYENVLEHLKYRRSALRVLSGMIVLHVLTDAFNFIWPFLTGRADALYFNLISKTHPFLKELFVAETSGAGIGMSILTGLSYLGNIIALLFLLLAPVLLWFIMYRDRRITFRGWILGIFSGSLVIYMLSPIFSIRTLSTNSLYGVDIIGQQAAANSLLPLPWTLLLGIVVGVLITLANHLHQFHHRSTNLLISISQLFLAYYIIVFFVSVSEYYITMIPSIWSSGQHILGIFFSIIFILTSLFYIIGVSAFLIDTHEHASSHLKET